MSLSRAFKAKLTTLFCDKPHGINFSVVALVRALNGHLVWVALFLTWLRSWDTVKKYLKALLKLYVTIKLVILNWGDISASKKAKFAR